MSQLFISDGRSIGVSASTSVLPMEHPGLISFRMDWLDLLAVQGTLKSHLQHHSSKASIMNPNIFFAFEWEAPGEKHQQMTWTVLPQGFRDRSHLFRQALSWDLLDLDLGPNGKIVQYVDDLLTCSPDENNAQHTNQVLKFLAEGI